MDYFQLNRAEYFVPLIVKVPGSELALAKRGGAEHTLLDFIGEIKDDFGTTVSNVRDKVDIKLSDATAAELAKRPIQYDTGFTLLPGKYKIKFLARDAETGRIGTYETPFVIPNLNKEDKRIPISSVVLSSQRVELKDALYNAAKDKGKAEIVNPLVQEGQKLIPSVTRVFSKGRDMYVYLQAYQPGVESAQPLVAFVTFYRGQAKAFETPPLQVTEALNNRLKTMPLKFSLSLAKLPPGHYNCQVTILDPSGSESRVLASARHADPVEALRQPKDIQRLAALRDLDVRRDRRRHISRAAAAQPGHHRDVLLSIHAVGNREALHRRA